MKYKLILVLWSISLQFALAQSYDFNAFKFPEVKVQGLTINGAGSLGDRVYIGDNVISISPRLLEASANTNLNYFSFTNTEREQGESSGRISLFADAYQNLPSLNIIRDNNEEFQINMNYSFIKRKYTLTNTYFEYGLSSFGSVSRGRREILENGVNTVTKSNSKFIDLNVPLRKGKGRIEPISQVFIANFVMEDLMSQGILTKALSQDSLFALAHLMGKLRNTRLFDGRILRKEQIRSIAKWFNTSSPRNEMDELEIYLTIQDNFYYAYFNTRGSGKRYSVGIKPFFNDRDTREPIYGSNVSFDYTTSKAKNKRVHLDSRIEIGAQGGNGISILSESAYIIPYVDMSYSYSFYPNSRTRSKFKAGIGAEYNHFFDGTYQNSKNIFQYINYNLDYFINYRLRATGIIDFGYNSNPNDISYLRNNKIPDNTLSFGFELIYSVF